MIKISDDTSRIVEVIFIITIIVLVSYMAGVNTVDSQRLTYYEMGLSDGYQQGMDQCGDAGWGG
jgi:hypothetical protein